MKVVDTTHILVAQLAAEIGARHFKGGQYRCQEIAAGRLAVVLCYLQVKRRGLDHGTDSVASQWSAAMGGAAVSSAQAGSNCCCSVSASHAW